MLNIISEAGWPIWLNIIASIIAVAIILDRFWILRKEVCIPKKCEETWRVALAAHSLPENTQSSVMDRILHTAVTATDKNVSALSDTMRNQATLESLKMERFLNTLGTIAAMAPLMGLLGTVIGMIEIFASQSPTGSDPAILARGISIALYNTAFGLIVAIPAMIFYRHFRAKVDRYLTDAEVIANRLLPFMEK